MGSRLRKSSYFLIKYMYREVNKESFMKDNRFVFQSIGIIHSPHKEISKIPIQPVFCNDIEGTIILNKNLHLHTGARNLQMNRSFGQKLLYNAKFGSSPIPNQAKHPLSPAFLPVDS